ncbi:MAG: T9SS type A sorting domain-containing protein, partial [Calditrichaeota bacterium]|nr:T9SS type A sorting domain-containing protein [Calditrichota bacterium]
WMVNTGDGTVMVASADTFALIVPLINSLDDQPGSLPSEFVLEQNYPNPFNPVTFIRFALPEALPVRVEVFNMLGQPVATLVNEMKPAGYHTVSFDGSELSSGIYFYRLEAGSFSQ